MPAGSPSGASSARPVAAALRCVAGRPPRRRRAARPDVCPDVARGLATGLGATARPGSRCPGRTCRSSTARGSRRPRAPPGAGTCWPRPPAAPEVILLGTGSEVQIAVASRETLEGDGIPTRVVSLPCWEWFTTQDRAYRLGRPPPGERGRRCVSPVRVDDGPVPEGRPGAYTGGGVNTPKWLPAGSCKSAKTSPSLLVVGGTSTFPPSRSTWVQTAATSWTTTMKIA